jgi:hypothetical protein
MATPWGNSAWSAGLLTGVPGPLPPTRRSGDRRSKRCGGPGALAWAIEGRAFSALAVRRGEDTGALPCRGLSRVAPAGSGGGMSGVGGWLWRGSGVDPAESGGGTPHSGGWLLGSRGDDLPEAGGGASELRGWLSRNSEGGRNSTHAPERGAPAPRVFILPSSRKAGALRSGSWG